MPRHKSKKSASVAMANFLGALAQAAATMKRSDEEKASKPDSSHESPQQYHGTSENGVKPFLSSTAPITPLVGSERDRVASKPVVLSNSPSAWSEIQQSLGHATSENEAMSYPPSNVAMLEPTGSGRDALPPPSAADACPYGDHRALLIRVNDSSLATAYGPSAYETCQLFRNRHVASSGTESMWRPTDAACPYGNIVCLIIDTCA